MEQFFKGIAVGDYVLATKYDDGDPCDAFCVGFVSAFLQYGNNPRARLNVVDNDGKLFRANGFRRAELLTAEEGAALCALFKDIGDKRGPSLWWHLAHIRGEPHPHDPCGVVAACDAGSDDATI